MGVRMKWVCENRGCENVFTRYPSYVERGVKRFCSQKCAGISQALKMKEEGRKPNRELYRREKPKWVEKIESMGLTKEAFLQLKEENDGTCEICKKVCGMNQQLAIDHSHVTGLFRGFLCFSCNTKLGWFENNQDSILNYLKKETR